MVELTLEKALLIGISLTIAAAIGIPLILKSLDLINELLLAQVLLIHFF